MNRKKSYSIIDSRWVFSGLEIYPAVWYIWMWERKQQIESDVTGDMEGSFGIVEKPTISYTSVPKIVWKLKFTHFFLIAILLFGRFITFLMGLFVNKVFEVFGTIDLLIFYNVTCLCMNTPSSLCINTPNTYMSISKTYERCLFLVCARHWKSSA